MSDFFQWDPSVYGIHVPAMDHDHEILIGYMNTLHSLHLAGAPAKSLAPALRNLVEFTKKHFAAEEAFMLKIDYPDRRVHGGIHKQLLTRMEQFAQEFAAVGRFTEEFFVFLKMWLKAHICGIDTKYAQTVARN